MACAHKNVTPTYATIRPSFPRHVEVKKRVFLKHNNMFTGLSVKV